MLEELNGRPRPCEHRFPARDHELEHLMYALIGLAAFVALIELAAIFGWGVDSRDGRDWQPVHRRG